MKDVQTNLFGETVKDENISKRYWNILSEEEKEEIIKRHDEKKIEADKLDKQRKDDLKSGKQATVETLFDM